MGPNIQGTKECLCCLREIEVLNMLFVRTMIQMKCKIISNLHKFIYNYMNVQKLLLLFSEL